MVSPCTTNDLAEGGEGKEGGREGGREKGGGEREIRRKGGRGEEKRRGIINTTADDSIQPLTLSSISVMFIT